MKIAVITIAGISSRFNEGICEAEKILKCLYTEDGREDTLLYRLMKECSFADHIVLVGGYRFEDLCSFYGNELMGEFPQAGLVRNEHYTELGSGYSLYLGIRAALEHQPDEILFVEGDLDIDRESFSTVADSGRSVLTYTAGPIYADRAVVLYQDKNGSYKYAFNESHGLLYIDEPFSCILNSGQLWKFTEMDALKKANDGFFRHGKEGTNLRIIQRYLELVDPGEVELIGLKRWTNCNTREDYKRIRKYWRDGR